MAKGYQEPPEMEAVAGEGRVDRRGRGLPLKFKLNPGGWIAVQLHCGAVNDPAEFRQNLQVTQVRFG